MSERTRTAGILAVILALTAYAYAPLLSAGFLGDDYRVLLSVDEAVRSGQAADLYDVQGARGRPGAALSLMGSRLLWTEGGRWTGAEALGLRLEHLALLLLAAWGMHGLLRRALTPWMGLDSAKAAAHAGAALLLLHPLATAAVGQLGSRGDLLVLALGAWSARLFLSGRQMNRPGRVAAAAVLATLASTCSAIAVLLPLIVAGMEYLSARRHRPRLVRMRTALTSLVVFGALVTAEWAARTAYAPAGLRGFQPLPSSSGGVALAFEKVGVLMLPVDTYGLGQAGYMVAALALLIGLHPGFVAARWAPRLWGRILIGWVVSVAATLAVHADQRVLPEALEHAHLLLPAGLVMAIGFGISSTALSGWRRTVIPTVVGALFAILGRGLTEPQQEAAQAVAALRSEMVSAARAGGWDTTLLVLDPPRRVAGVDALGGGLEVLLAQPFLPSTRSTNNARVVVRGLEMAALRAFLREPEFDTLRERGVTLMLEASRLGAAEDAGRVAVDLPPMGVGEERITLLGEGRTPPGKVLDPLKARCFRIIAMPGASTQEPPIIRWETSGDVPGAEVSGVWLAGSPPVAIFDLESSLPWLFGGPVRSTWFPGALNFITSGQASTDPPLLPADLQPQRTGPRKDDWLFDLAGVELPEPVAGRAYWTLGLLDVGRLRFVNFSPLAEGEELLFEGVGAWVEAALVAGGGPVAWTLERRVDHICVTRTPSRRARAAASDGE